jgi:hypothetical protein
MFSYVAKFTCNIFYYQKKFIHNFLWVTKFLHKKVYKNNIYIIYIKLYSSKVYKYLSLYGTVLPVKCPSIITIIPSKIGLQDSWISNLQK